MSDPTVAELLEASHRAHWLYQQNVPRMTSQGGILVAAPGNPPESRRYLVEANDARVQAQALDPEHLDQAWRDEATAFPHDELLEFYALQIAKS